jgi:hypothetical protein
MTGANTCPVSVKNGTHLMIRLMDESPFPLFSFPFSENKEREPSILS